MEILINLVAWAALNALWIVSEPGIRFRSWLVGDRFNWFVRLINCGMCSGFWFYFLWHIFINGRVEVLGAAFVAVLTEFIVRKLEA